MAYNKLKGRAEKPAIIAFRRSRRSTYSYTPHAARIDESTGVSLALHQTEDFVFSLRRILSAFSIMMRSIDSFNQIPKIRKILGIHYRGKRKEGSGISLFSRKAPDDEDIIGLYFKRDESAISQTDSKYGTQIRRIIGNILNSEQDCEECRNETYLAVWNRIPPAKPSSLGAFAAKIARDTAINRYYKNKRKKEIPSELTLSMEECEDFFSDGETPEDELVAGELGGYIGEFLMTLSEKRRFIFLERFYFAEPVKRVAKSAGVGESAVYKELTKLKRELKEFLAEKGVYV